MIMNLRQVESIEDFVIVHDKRFTSKEPEKISKARGHEIHAPRPMKIFLFGFDKPKKPEDLCEFMQEI